MNIKNIFEKPVNTSYSDTEKLVRNMGKGAGLGLLGGTAVGIPLGYMKGTEVGKTEIAAEMTKLPDSVVISYKEPVVKNGIIGRMPRYPTFEGLPSNIDQLTEAEVEEIRRSIPLEDVWGNKPVLDDKGNIIMDLKTQTFPTRKTDLQYYKPTVQYEKRDIIDQSLVGHKWISSWWGDTPPNVVQINDKTRDVNVRNQGGMVPVIRETTVGSYESPKAAGEEIAIDFTSKYNGIVRGVLLNMVLKVGLLGMLGGTVSAVLITLATQNKGKGGN